MHINRHIFNGIDYVLESDCNAEIERLKKENEQRKDEYLMAAELVADMFETVTHNRGGPKRGVLEDVRDVMESLITENGQLKQSLWPMKDLQIAQWKNSFENMRDFAKNSGLDIMCSECGQPTNLDLCACVSIESI